MASLGPRPQPQPDYDGFQPINYIYLHLHDSIRAELDTLASAVLQLQVAGSQAGAVEPLSALRDRYRFLEQIYKYHSSVEDEASRRPAAADNARRLLKFLRERPIAFGLPCPIAGGVPRPRLQGAQRHPRLLSGARRRGGCWGRRAVRRVHVVREL